jgi:hypothetical protein
VDRDASRWAFAAVAALVGLPVVWIADRLTGGVPASATDRLATTLACALAAWLAVGLLLHRRTGRDPRSDTVVLAVGTAFAQLAGHTILFVLHAGDGTATGCLPAVGRGAAAGVELALLRPDAACPPGTAAAGPTLLAAWAALLVTVLIVAGHALVATVAALVLAAGSASLRVLRTLGGVLLAPLPELAAVPVTGRPRIRATRTRVRRVWRWVTPAQRRGPPLTATA